MGRTIDYTICSVCGVAVPTLDLTIHWNNHYRSTSNKLKKYDVWADPVGKKWRKKDKR